MTVLQKFLKDNENREMSVFLDNGIKLTGLITQHDEEGFVVGGCYVSKKHYISLSVANNKKGEY